MKKLFFSSVALLATAGMAMGVGFELPVIEVMPGATVEIPISAVGAADIQGVNLNIEVDPSLVLAGDGGSFTGDVPALSFANGIFAGNYSTPNITVSNPYLIGSTTTNSGTVATPGVIAVMTVIAPTEQGDYFVRTYVPDFGMISDFGLIAPDSQGDGIVRVIPEPATALLLIGAIPFLRRRRA